MLRVFLLLLVLVARGAEERWRRRLGEVEVPVAGVGFEPRPGRRTLNPPPGLKNQAKEERLYLKLHKCKDAGEVYSAAYLIHKTHLMEQFTDYNLTWVNCEMGSFIMMNQRADPNKSLNGSLTQSLDVLDFSVIHLSAYERLQRRWGGSIAKIVGKEVAKQMHTGNIDPVVKATALLKERALRSRAAGTPFASPRLNRTLAIMPFLGSDNGAGHSLLGNRKIYLQSCFWSIYAEMPHIVAAVKSVKDMAYARSSEVGLPFFDVMLMPDLPKSASLPVSTVQWTKRRLHPETGMWRDMFDYVYFTESDQILVMRAHDDLYDHLDAYPRRLLVPHRLIPYPEPILTHFHKRRTNSSGLVGMERLGQAGAGAGAQPSPSHEYAANAQASAVAGNSHPLAFYQQNCCTRRQNCHGKRDDWIHVRNSSVAVVNMFGLLVPLGNNNFHAETYRACALDVAGGVEVCP